MTIFVSKNSQQGDSDDPPPKKKPKKSKSLIRSHSQPHQAHVVNLPTTSTGAGPSQRLPDQIGLFPYLPPQQNYFASPEGESYLSSPQHYFGQSEAGFFGQTDQEIVKFELDKFDVGIYNDDSDPYTFETEDYAFQDPAVPGTSKIVGKSHIYTNPDCLEYYIYGPGSRSPNSKACRGRPKRPLPDVDLIEVISSEEIIAQEKQIVKSEEGGSLLDDIHNFDIDDKFGELEKFQQEAIWEDSKMYHMEKSLDAGVMMNGYDKITTPEGPQYENRLLRNSPAASLSNLGNTCFLNSVLYTLRFAPNFLHNLHHLVGDMNLNTSASTHIKQKTSSLGRNMNLSWSANREATANGAGEQPAQVKTKKQIVTEKLHEVYHAMRTAESKEHIDPFHPDVFLTALREVNPIFEGNQQQDAHELLVCLLDIFREASKASARQAETRAALEIHSFSTPAGPAASETDSPVLKLTSSNVNKPWGSMMAVRNSLKSRKNEKNEKNLTGLNNPAKKKNKRELDRVDSMEATENGEETPMGPAGVGQGQGQGEAEPAERVQLQHNFVAQDFEGVMVLQTTCLECENTTEKKEPFADICVPIKTDYNDDDDDSMGPMNPSDLYQRAVVTDEFLRDRNKYYCEECRRYNEARRSVRYQALPRLLTLQLKRFSSTYGAMSKVTQYMPTPMTLTCFCEDCRGVGGGTKPRTPAGRHGYVLYGVIMHLGPNMAGGHYIAYVKTSDSIQHYRTCAREKPRKASSLSSESGKNHKANNKLVNFFKAKGASSTALNDKMADTNLVSPRKLCWSLECCGVKGRGEDGGEEGSGEDSLWIACDDDNVKLLRGAEVEELLAKNSTSNATPYLLFYSRTTE